MSDVDVIKRARLALALNGSVVKTEVNYFDKNDSVKALQIIGTALREREDYWSLCFDLAANYSLKFGDEWACVAGVNGYYSATHYGRASYVEVNYDDLRIVLFKTK